MFTFQSITNWNHSEAFVLPFLHFLCVWTRHNCSFSMSERTFMLTCVCMCVGMAYETQCQYRQNVSDKYDYFPYFGICLCVRSVFQWVSMRVCVRAYTRERERERERVCMSVYCSHIYFFASSSWNWCIEEKKLSHKMYVICVKNILRFDLRNSKT